MDNEITVTVRYLLILLLIAGCGPSVGDTYEHKMTETRYRVDRIGTCGDLYDYYKDEDEDRLVWYPRQDEGNSNRCVGLTDGGSSISLEKVDYFKEQYAKVY